jgi:hypothetical protein
MTAYMGTFSASAAHAARVSARGSEATVMVKTSSSHSEKVPRLQTRRKMAMPPMTTAAAIR